jgi:hypothetical protein
MADVDARYPEMLAEDWAETAGKRRQQNLSADVTDDC